MIVIGQGCKEIRESVVIEVEVEVEVEERCWNLGMAETKKDACASS